MTLQVLSPFYNTFYGFFTRWIRDINTVAIWTSCSFIKCAKCAKCVHLRWSNPLTLFDSPDLSMTRGALTGWGCLPSRPLASCLGSARLRTPSLFWEGRSWRIRSTRWTLFWSTTDSKYQLELVICKKSRSVDQILISLWSFPDLLNGANLSRSLIRSTDMQQYPITMLSMLSEGRERTSEYKMSNLTQLQHKKRPLRLRYCVVVSLLV